MDSKIVWDEATGVFLVKKGDQWVQPEIVLFVSHTMQGGACFNTRQDLEDAGVRLIKLEEQRTTRARFLGNGCSWAIEPHHPCG